jgi:hypothetical protein
MWTLQEYLAKDFVLANANDADCAEKVDRRLSFDPLVVALREGRSGTSGRPVCVRARPAACACPIRYPPAEELILRA